MAPSLKKAPSLVSLNRNTNWMSGPGVWTFYVLLICAMYFIFAAIVGGDTSAAWLLTTYSHFVLSFYLLHWHRGTPTEFQDQGEYDSLTYWEQMDGGDLLTPNKKFFSVVPVLLCVCSLQGTAYAPPHALGQVLATAVLLVAKLPQMNKVRLFGINRGASGTFSHDD